MNRFLHLILCCLFAAVALLSAGCSREDAESRVIRVGCFPNVTHVQALVARNMSRHGQGWFERYLPDYTLEWYTYNAGPTAMEALFGKTADLTYVGPSPAINAYAVSAGREIRLMAGAVNGGAALLVAPQSGITKPADFRGRTIATPQLGNTQDVSCRAWLLGNGLICTLEGGGDCRVAPTPNAMQAQLMAQGNLDAAWTVEPWVTVLEQKANARIMVQEPDVVTTVLVGRVGWLKHHPQQAALFLQAHRELTEWIIAHPEEAQQRIAEELSELTHTPVDPATVAAAWPRLKLTDEIDLLGLHQFVQDARAADLLDRVPPLEDMLYRPTPEQEPTDREKTL